jgi:hypothetical protein
MRARYQRGADATKDVIHTEDRTTKGCQQRVDRPQTSHGQPLDGSKPSIAASPSYSKDVGPPAGAGPTDAWSVRGRQLLPHAQNSRALQATGLPGALASAAAAAPKSGTDSEQQPDQGPSHALTHSSCRAADGADLLAALDTAAKEAVATAWDARRCLRTGDVCLQLQPEWCHHILCSSCIWPCIPRHHPPYISSLIQHTSSVVCSWNSICCGT